MKRPAFQFYPADWRKDAALQSCSLAARGLWHEMLCIMHECAPYGHLLVGANPMTAAQLSRLVGEPERSVALLLAEIETAGVLSRSDSGAIFSRRMVKDETLRSVRAQSGKLGGNPALLDGKDKHKVNQKVNQPSKQTPTPSSSSSSSTTTTTALPEPTDHDTSASTPPPTRSVGRSEEPESFGFTNVLTTLSALGVSHNRVLRPDDRETVHGWIALGVDQEILDAAIAAADASQKPLHQLSTGYLDPIIRRLHYERDHPEARPAEKQTLTDQIRENGEKARKILEAKGIL